jgi:3'(2'), 5'-bisphosphate nucleotidase/myo-inositol-1(or 4)-monophosphatase
MLEDFARILREVGAELLARRRSSLADGSWQEGQFKAAVDRFAHDALTSELSKIAPDLPILSEEDLASHWRERPDSYLIIDPVDGTASYAHGFPGYVTQIAMIQDDQPQLGAIYAPETDELYLATRGQGATCNGRPLSTSRDQCRLFLTDNYPEPRGIAADLASSLNITGYLESGSLSLKICRVADGSADLFVKDVVVRDWDIAPAHLILEEAGGVLTLLNGQPMVYRGDLDKPGLLVARDQNHHARALAACNDLAASMTVAE